MIRLVRTLCDWEVPRMSAPRHEGAALSVHGNVIERLILVAAQVGGIQQSRTGGVHFHDEAVANTTPVIGLQGARRGLEVISRHPCHVGAAGSVHGDSLAYVTHPVLIAERKHVEPGARRRTQLRYEGSGMLRKGITIAKLAGDVGVARCIQCDASGLVVT